MKKKRGLIMAILITKIDRNYFKRVMENKEKLITWRKKWKNIDFMQDILLD